MRSVLPWTIALFAGGLAGCGSGAGDCTDLGCEHEAIVTYPPGLVGGPYDLLLRTLAQTSAARCFDPSAPETADNPPGLTCDLAMFELRGHPFANERAVFVTIVSVPDDEVLVDDVEVRLDAVDMHEPNGPGCPPTCFTRNGQLLLGAPE